MLYRAWKRIGVDYYSGSRKLYLRWLHVKGERSMAKPKVTLVGRSKKGWYKFRCTGEGRSETSAYRKNMHDAMYQAFCWWCYKVGKHSSHWKDPKRKGYVSRYEKSA